MFINQKLTGSKFPNAYLTSCLKLIFYFFIIKLSMAFFELRKENLFFNWP